MSPEYLEKGSWLIFQEGKVISKLHGSADVYSTTVKEAIKKGSNIEQ